MFKANLRNQVRQTPLPKWKSLTLFEAVVNSTQSIRDTRRPPGASEIRIEIEPEGDPLDSDQGHIRTVSIINNGINTDDINFDSFNTAYSDLKQSVSGKEVGRFTWLKAFEKAEITSVFQPQAGHRFVAHSCFITNTTLTAACRAMLKVRPTSRYYGS